MPNASLKFTTIITPKDQAFLVRSTTAIKS
jgi:hypothetical protein